MKLLQKLLLATTSLCISLLMMGVVGELVLRIHAPMMSRLQNTHIILPRNRTYVYANRLRLRGCDPRIVHHKNSLGFRGAEPPQNFDHALTMVAVGGSTTECFYLSDGHSWPEVVGQKLQKDYPDFWINNAGFDGHSTFGHIMLTHDYLIPLRPKYVLFLVGINDVGRDDLVKYDESLLKSSKTTVKSALIVLGEKSRMIAWLENLIRAWRAWHRGLEHSALDLNTLGSLTIPEAMMRETLQHHVSTYIPAYETRLRTLITLCKNAGIQPIFITQPALYGRGVDPETGVNLETLQVHPHENGTLAWRTLELYNDATRLIAREATIPVIDAAHELPKTSLFFYDFFHFTNTGAVAMAEIVAHTLRTLLPH